MLAEQWTTRGPISEAEFLYLWKTLQFFEDLVREEAAEQRIPLEILRVLKECRLCVIFAEDAFFCHCLPKVAVRSAFLGRRRLTLRHH